MSSYKMSSRQVSSSARVFTDFSKLNYGIDLAIQLGNPNELDSNGNVIVSEAIEAIQNGGVGKVYTKNQLVYVLQNCNIPKENVSYDGYYYYIVKEKEQEDVKAISLA